MSKRLWAIGGAAGLLIVAGVVMYLVFTGGDKQKSLEPASTNGTPAFNAKTTAGQSFVANMLVQTDQGEARSTIRSDGKGTAHYQSTLEGQTINMYLTAQDLISCQDDQCVRMPATEEQQAVNQDAYKYDQAEIQKFKESSTYIGRESCPAGTCNVWSVEDGDREFTTKVYLSSEGQVSKLTSEGPAGKTSITYRYQPVSIDVPTNVRELPAAQ